MRPIGAVFACSSLLLGGVLALVVPIAVAEDNVSEGNRDRSLEIAPAVGRYEIAKVVAVTDDGMLPRVAKGPLQVIFSALSKEFRLHLVESDILAEDAKTIVVDDTGSHEIPATNYSYTGTLEGDPEAVVRVTIVGDSLKGVSYSSDGEIGIEPLRHYDSKARRRVSTSLRHSLFEFTDVPPSSSRRYRPAGLRSLFVAG